MKTLYLIRHAKSDWSSPGQRDFDRVLNARGEKNAPQMAEHFRRAFGVPDHVLCSTAVRAKLTADAFLTEWKISPNRVEWREDIYEAHWDHLLKVVNGLDDAHDQVVMFGHNPGFSQLATYLSGHPIEMPTCAIVAITFAWEQWQLVSGETGYLNAFVYPKLLV